MLKSSRPIRFRRPDLVPTLIWIAVLILLSACSGTSTPPPNNPTIPPAAGPTSGTRTTVRPTLRPTLVSTVQTLNCSRTLVGGQTPRVPTLPLTALLKCRPEVQQAVSNINRGRFNYSQDDQTFGNRERYLPGATSGTYREYTVDTPDASTRGTRRIITAGPPNRQANAFTDIYYTDDHYDSFWLVTSGN